MKQAIRKALRPLGRKLVSILDLDYHDVRYYPKGMVYDIAYYVAALNKIEGDYVEFGTADGTSFSEFFRGFASKEKFKDIFDNMTFWAFDSFEGLPKLEGIDKEFPHHWKEGDFAYTEEKFKKLIAAQGVDLKKVETVKGFYKETLNDDLKSKIKLKKISVAYIDCDFYESTVPVLDFITDYLQDGSIIVFNDWWAYNGNPSRGEQKAFYEWLDRNPELVATEFIRAGYKDVSFVINKKIQ